MFSDSQKFHIKKLIGFKRFFGDLYAFNGSDMKMQNDYERKTGKTTYYQLT